MVFTTDEKRPLLDNTCTSQTAAARRRRLWRNAVVLNLTALLGYSGTIGLSSVQSSLNSDQGLGVISMAVSSFFGLLGAMLSGVVINVLGCKRTIVCAQLLAALTLASNFYPTWATLITSSCISGVAGLALVVGHRVYTAELGHHYSDTIDSRSSIGSSPISRTRAQGRFFLFYVAAYKISYTIGNLMASLILGSGIASDETPAHSLLSNLTTTAPPQCGAAYCNEDLGSDFHDAADRSRIYALIGFCMGMCALSTAIAFFFLDDLTDLPQEVEKGVLPIPIPPSSLVSVWNTFLKTLAMHRNSRMLLIVPTAVSLMAMDSFWIADFTKAFITCPIGMESIGYVVMWIGVSATLASVAFGWMSSRRLRCGPMVLAPLAQAGLGIGLLYWEPDQDSLVALCAYTAAWALCAGIRHSIFSAIVGIVFRDQLGLAFSNVIMWSSIGNTLIFLFSSFLCTDIKLFLVMAMLGLAVVTYVILEVLLEMDRSRARQKFKTHNDFKTNLEDNNH